MKRNTSQGFTLIELAVALTIVTLVIGGLAVPMSKRIAEQQYTDTQATLDKAVEALVGFAILNRRLPCPDVPSPSAAGVADGRVGFDGMEDTVVAAAVITGCDAGAGGINSDAGNASWGMLPWQTLGLAPPNNADAWNNRLRYAVYEPLTHGGVSVFPASLGAAPMLDIRCGNPAAASPPYVAAPGCLPTAGAVADRFVMSDRAVFVVYSVGANGFGGTPITGAVTRELTLPNTSDQAANVPEQVGTLKTTPALRRQFITRARTDATSTAGEFDDLLTFMSSNTLAAKLLNAGVYP